MKAKNPKVSLPKSAKQVFTIKLHPASEISHFNSEAILLGVRDIDPLSMSKEANLFY